MAPGDIKGDRYGVSQADAGQETSPYAIYPHAPGCGAEGRGSVYPRRGIDPGPKHRVRIYRPAQ